MYKRKLVLDALENREPERVPVGFWYHYAVGQEVYDGLKDPSIVRKNIEGHLRFWREFEPDFVKLMSDGFFGHPDETLSGARRAADLRSIRSAGPHHPWIERQVELVKTLVDHFGGDALTFYSVFSPATTLKFLFGDGEKGNRTLAAFIAEDPESVRHAINVLSEDLSTLSGRVIDEAGADGVYVSVQNVTAAQGERIPDDVYREVIAPGERAIIDCAERAGGKSILHICGYDGFRNDLALYAGYGATAFNWAVTTEGVSLAEGKKLFGDRAVIGGFANARGGLLHSGSREEIESYTGSLIADAGKRGIILGADCTLPADIDLDRLRWVREKAGTV